MHQVTRELNTARQRIYLNVLGNESRCIFATLTYNNVVTEKKLQSDLHNFHTAVCRYVGHHEYIDFIQFGNYQSYHCHSVLIFNSDINIIGEKIISCWKNKGSIDIKNIFDTLGIIKYLSSLNGSDCGLDSSICKKINIWNYDPTNYLEYPIEQQKQIKSYIRNQRIHYYPPYFRAVRYSQRLKKEKIEYYTDEGIIDLFGDKLPSFTKEIKVKGTGVINTYKHFDYTD